MAGVYLGKNRLSNEELQSYRKDNKCFNCGEQGHVYRTCPKKKPRNAPPRVSMVEAPKEDGHHKDSPLAYAWGKLRDQDALFLFDPGSTHNFISNELATKLGVQDFEMGEVMPADGVSKGQEVPVTPLIGKLRFHVHKQLEGQVCFKFRERDMVLIA